MSEGKDSLVAKRFEQYVGEIFLQRSVVRLISFVLARINQYFDGKRTDDEILHRAEISRRQLREVLHHYEEYVSHEFHHDEAHPEPSMQLQTFLHPS
jgi:hypothetical protein